MNTSTIQLLLIEDNPADALLVREMLNAAQHMGWDLPRCEIKHVARLQGGLDCLESETFDVILSDLDLPDSRAEYTVATLRESAPQMPLVVLTGREDEALARKSVRAGVQDYLYKDEATGSLLIRAMMYAIERQQTRDVLEQRVAERTTELRQVNAALSTSERRYRTLFEEALNPILLVDEEGRYIDANQAGLDFLECGREDLVGMRVWDFTPPALLEQQQKEHAPFMAPRTLETEYLVHGTIKTLLLNVVPMEVEGQAILYGIGHDITERKEAEDALRESDTRYCSLFQDYPISIWEEDFSEVKTYLDDLQASDVTDFAAYFEEHPEAVTHCLGLVRIMDANEAALALRGAESKGDFSRGLDGFLSEEARAGFADELVQIAGGATRVEVDVVDRTPQGERCHLAVTWQVAPGHEETLARCLVSVRDITERKEVEQTLQAREARTRQKLDSVLSPDGDLSGLGLADIIDVESLQALMDDFYALTDIGIAIVDLDGEVLVATGWQDICTKFHRVHPDTCRYCMESDIELSSGVEPGTYKLYKCKNHMWDMATPLMVGERHVGNLFLGQFFFEEETVDRELFRRQAQQYGFDEEAYLAALDRVPRWSQEKLDRVFKFYIQFADMISDLSHSNLQLARALTEKERLLAARKASEQKFKGYIAHAPYAVYVTDEEGRLLDVNEAASRMTGYDRGELLEMHILELAAPDRQAEARKHFQTLVERGFETGVEPYIKKDGGIRWWSMTAVRLSETRFLGYAEDVTERRQTVEALEKREERYRRLVEGSPNILYIYSNQRGALYWSPRVEEVLGYKPEALIEAPHQWRAAIHPDDIAPVDAAITGADEGTGFSFEYRIMDADGDWHWFRDHFISKRQIEDETIIEGLATDITEHKQAEEALRESEAKMRSIFRAAPAGVGLVSGRELLEVNDRLCEMVGYNRDELLGQSARILYPTDDDYEYVGREKYRQIQEQGTGTVETRFQRKDGTILDVLLSSTPLDLSDLSVGVTFTALDITERKEAEQALRESEERFRKSFDTEMVAMAVSRHRDGTYLEVNPGFLKLTGYAYDEIIGHTSRELDFLSSDQRQQMMADLDEEGGLHNQALTFPAKGGELRTVLFSLGPIVINDEACLLAIMVDITEHRQAEKALRESEERLHLTLQGAPIGIGIVDREGDLIDCNAALAEMIGYSRKELLVLSFADFTHPDDLEREWQLIHELWDDESAEYRMEKRYLHKDGHVVWVDVAASLFKDDVGDLAFGFAFVQDITERKQAREARRLNEQRMQALLELSKMREAPPAEISDFVLAQAVNLTKSELGFLGFIDEDEEQMTLHTWSEKAMRGCDVDNKPRHFWLDEAGVWAEAVRQRRPLMLNDYTRPHPQKRGYPEGHVPLTRLLSVPIAERSGVEAVIAVANKEAAYDKTDVRQIQLLSEGMLRLVRERRAAAELRKSEKKLRTLVENVVDWVWQVDEDGVYTYASPQVKVLTGYPVSEVLGKTRFDFMVPEEAERVAAIFAETAAAQESIRGLEDTLIAKDGREILFETNAAPLFDADGELVGYMGTCRDITERKRAEEALRASEARYRYIFRTAGVPIWEEDFSAVKAAIDALEVENFCAYLEDHPAFLTQAQQLIKIRDINPATLKMLGARSKEEAKGALDKVFVPETRQILKDELIALAEGENYFEGETVNRTLQGEQRNILLTMAIPPDPENLDSVLISTMDITERKRAQAALQESERQKNLILNATAETVAYYDTDLRIIWANRAAAESAGKMPEALIGAHCYEIRQGRQRPCVGCPILKARDEKTSQQDEMQTPDGRHWLLRGYPILDDAGEVMALVEFGQDITKRKEAEQKIEQYDADLRRSNRELQQFAYVVSHDLKAPLRTLKAYLRLLVENCDQHLDERANMYIHHVLESAQRMQDMIDALLNLSRVETQGQSFAPTDCDLLVQQVVEDLQSPIEETGTEISCDPLPTVLADRAQLARVFQNLIANAIKFRRADAPSRVHISAELGPDVWTFAVADTGIGIDPNQIERIFQIFQRLHTEEEYPGLGIGLALCQRIVARHGGRIWVESEPGAGSTFYFTIPTERRSHE